MLSEAGILQVLRGTVELNRVVENLLEDLGDSNSDMSSNMVSETLLSPVLDFSKWLHILCLSLHSKASKPPSKTAGRRNRKASERGKRGSEALDNLHACALSFEELGVDEDLSLKLRACLQYVQRQLATIESYPNVK